MALTTSPGSRSLAPGTRLGRYTLIQRISRGGMAEVYLARAEGIEGFQKPVALKLLHGHLTESPEFIQMFLNEARLAAALDHPNVCNVLDLGEAQGEHFIAMEYIHGHSLRDLLRRGREPLQTDAALSIVGGACAGLHYVHEHCGPDGRPRRMVHRDVSPSNVMIRSDGGVKIVDFGIAKAIDMTSGTRTGTIKGKAGYMSPEQTFGEPLDRRSDIFSLGVVLYETTTGRRMFYGDNERAVMNRICDGVFKAPSEIVPGYPEELERILRRAVATAPDDRYPTAEALLSDIDDFMQAAQLRRSDSIVGRVMLAAFGEEPPPTVTEQFGASDEDATAVNSPKAVVTTPGGEAEAAPRSAAGWLIGAGLLVLGGTLGAAWMTQAGPNSDPDAPVGAVQSSPPIDEERATQGAPIDEPPPSEEAGPTPEAALPPSGSEPTTAPEKPAPAPSKARSKTPKNRGGRRSKRKSKSGSKRDPIRPL